MSIFQINPVLSRVKKLLQKHVYRPGQVRTILFGPLRGYKYRIAGGGWAPLYGGLEPASQKVYARLIKPGDTVYDLGANVGIHSLLFAKLTGPDGQVMAFEPLPRNIAEIEFFKQLNGVSNVTVMDLAAGNAQGTAEFWLGTNDSQGSLMETGSETGKKITVQVARLDDLIGAGLPPPDFLKIDIEGAEGDALDGFDESTAKLRPTFAVDLHTPEQDLRVGAFFKKHGYALYRVKNHDAERINGQKGLLRKIENLEVGWPNPAGVWGVVVAVHPSRQSRFRDFLPVR